jgi:hypothetical protein
MNFQRNPFLKQGYRPPIGPLGPAYSPLYGLGAAAEPAAAGAAASSASTTPMIPASIAQQIFAITASAAGGVVGFVLAYKLRNALMVNTTEVAIATSAIIAATFGSLFLFRTFETFPESTPPVVTPTTPEVTP